MNLFYNPERKYCIAVLGYAQTLQYLNESLVKIRAMAGVSIPENHPVEVRYIYNSPCYKYMFVLEFAHDTRPSKEWFETANEAQMGL